MILEEALIQRLMGSATISGLVGTRINWVSRPDGKSLPSVTLQHSGDPRDYNHDGPVDLQYARIQFDVWASTFSSATAVKRAILFEMEAAQTVDNVIFEDALLIFSSDMPKAVFEGGTEAFRITMDFSVPHREL